MVPENVRRQRLWIPACAGMTIGLMAASRDCFSRALESAWSLIGAVNKYLVDEEPWIVAEKEGEENRSRLATILYTAAEALRIVTALAHPVLPESTAKIWTQLGLAKSANLTLAISSGPSYRWAASSAKWNRYSRAPIKLQSRGCN